MININELTSFVRLGQGLIDAGASLQQIDDLTSDPIRLGALVREIKRLSRTDSMPGREPSLFQLIGEHKAAYNKIAQVISTVKELSVCSPSVLRPLQSIGPKTLSDIETSLHAAGRRLRGDNESYVERVREVYPDILEAPVSVLYLDHNARDFTRLASALRDLKIDTVAQMIQQSPQSLAGHTKVTGSMRQRVIFDGDIEITRKQLAMFRLCLKG
mgnify:CR=1 FL=1